MSESRKREHHEKQKPQDSDLDLSPPRNPRRRRSRSPVRRHDRQRSPPPPPHREGHKHVYDKESRHDRHRSHSPRRRRRRSSDGEVQYKDERSRSDWRESQSRHHGRRSSIDQDQRRSHDKERTATFHDSEKFGKSADDAPSDKEDEGPNFKTSGKLAAETNTYKGVVIIYSEPPEARIPKTRWRLYPFKGDQQLHVLYVHRQSAYLIGRDRKVVDMPIDHPSCSKQHAALQYRLVQVENEEGRNIKKTKPYIIDLNSTNGTYINNQRIDPRRYYELKEKDVLKFGFSSREYVLLTEMSADSPHSEHQQSP